ncbi:MAG: site-2 protease family protein [Bryobacteraceae bacterium]
MIGRTGIAQAVPYTTSYPFVDCRTILAVMDREAKSTSFWKLLSAALGIGLATNLILPPSARILVGLNVENISGLTALFAALTAAVVFHESGHLMAAIAMNFEVLGGSLGPVRATRLHGDWEVQFSLETPFSASVSAIPRGVESWRKRMLVVAAGGPTATLMMGIVSVLSLLRTQQNTWWSYFFAALTQFNFFIFVLGLISNGPDAKVRNDAQLFLSVLRNTAEAEEILLHHLVMQMTIAGVRPRDYPRDLIAKLAAAKGRPDVNSVFAYTIAMWAVDRGDPDTAAAWNQRMAELSQNCNPRLRNLMLARSACFAVLFEDDAAAAKMKFAGVKCGILSPEFFKHRAKAARWLAFGDIPRALAETYRAEGSFPQRLPYYEYEKMLLSRLHQKALAARPGDLSDSSMSHAA